MLLNGVAGLHSTLQTPSRPRVATHWTQGSSVSSGGWTAACPHAFSTLRGGAAAVSAIVMLTGEAPVTTQPAQGTPPPTGMHRKRRGPRDTSSLQQPPAAEVSASAPPQQPASSPTRPRLFRTQATPASTPAQPPLTHTMAATSLLLTPTPPTPPAVAPSSPEAPGPTDPQSSDSSTAPPPDHALERAVGKCKSLTELQDLTKHLGRKLAPKEIVLVCNRLGKLVVPDTMNTRAWYNLQEYASMLAAASIPGMGTLDNYDMLVLLAGLAQARYRPSTGWLQAYCTASLPQLPTLGPGYISLTLKSLTKLDCQLYHLKEADAFHVWMQKLMDVALDKVWAYRLEELVNTLDALAQLHWRPPQPWLTSFSLRLRTKLEHMDTSQLARTLAALSSLKGHHEPGLLQGLCTQLTKKLPMFDDDDLATFAQALALLKTVLHREMFTGFMLEVARKSHLFSVHSLVHLLSALAELVHAKHMAPCTPAMWGEGTAGAEIMLRMAQSRRPAQGPRAGDMVARPRQEQQQQREVLAQPEMTQQVLPAPGPVQPQQHIVVQPSATSGTYGAAAAVVPATAMPAAAAPAQGLQSAGLSGLTPRRPLFTAPPSHTLQQPQVQHPQPPLPLQHHMQQPGLPYSPASTSSSAATTTRQDSRVDNPQADAAGLGGRASTAVEDLNSGDVPELKAPTFRPPPHVPNVPASGLPTWQELRPVQTETKPWVPRGVMGIVPWTQPIAPVGPGAYRAAEQAAHAMQWRNSMAAGGTGGSIGWRPPSSLRPSPSPSPSLTHVGATGARGREQLQGATAGGPRGPHQEGPSEPLPAPSPAWLRLILSRVLAHLPDMHPAQGAAALRGLAVLGTPIDPRAWEWYAELIKDRTQLLTTKSLLAVMQGMAVSRYRPSGPEGLATFTAWYQRFSELAARRTYTPAMVCDMVSALAAMPVRCSPELLAALLQQTRTDQPGALRHTSPGRLASLATALRVMGYAPDFGFMNSFSQAVRCHWSNMRGRELSAILCAVAAINPSPLAVDQRWVSEMLLIVQCQLDVIPPASLAAVMAAAVAFGSSPMRHGPARAGVPSLRWCQAVLNRLGEQPQLLPGQAAAGVVWSCAMVILHHNNCITRRNQQPVTEQDTDGAGLVLPQHLMSQSVLEGLVSRVSSQVHTLAPPQVQDVVWALQQMHMQVPAVLQQHQQQQAQQPLTPVPVTQQQQVQLSGGVDSRSKQQQQHPHPQGFAHSSSSQQLAAEQRPVAAPQQQPVSRGSAGQQAQGTAEVHTGPGSSGWASSAQPGAWSRPQFRVLDNGSESGHSDSDSGDDSRGKDVDSITWVSAGSVHSRVPVLARAEAGAGAQPPVPRGALTGFSHRGVVSSVGVVHG